MVVAANQDTVFRRLCAAMGRPELSTDDQFANHAARGRNQDELDTIIADWAAAKPPGEIIAELGVCRGDQRSHQHRRRGRQRPAAAARVECWSTTTTNGSAAPCSGRESFPRSRKRRAPYATPARQPGQHDTEVYTELLGIGEADLESLRAKGVL